MAYERVKPTHLIVLQSLMKLESYKYIGKYSAWTRGLILKPALLHGKDSFLEERLGTQGVASAHFTGTRCRHELQKYM